MITTNTNLKQPKSLLSYWTTVLIFFFIVTLPLEEFIFLPAIILLALYFIFRIQYKNFSFLYDDNHIEIKKGVFTKSQKTIPFSNIQNINVVSGIIMRRFDLAKLEIWTSSPAQIAITPTINGRGNRTEHRPDGLIYLTGEDAESLRNFILGHRQTPVTTSIVSATN